MINVTKSFLPPIEEYIEYLHKIWDSNQLTNNGPLVKELEQRLKEYLGVKHLFFVSNGTIALQIAIKALALHGEVITTPFSYVATTSSLVWEGCQPVFVDIDPQTLCINPDLIEDAITEKTTGILVTHVYGIPCAVEKIKALADKYDLKVIYDAAHTFGVNFKDKPLVSWGNISILSFHATKIFHTVEGGALITNNDDIAHRINFMRNFGHKGNGEYWGLGINGKNTEFHAAMGLCILPKINQIIHNRKHLTGLYNSELFDIDLFNPIESSKFIYNYSYYPLVFPNEESILRVQKVLNQNNIYPRRYFYPSLNTIENLLSSSLDNCPISEDIVNRVICLPLYESLEEKEIYKISAIVRNNI